MNAPFRMLTAIAGTVFLATACDRESSTRSAASDIRVSAADRDQAKTVFTQLCSACHGTGGRGDGPGSAGLDPKPRSFGDQAWQASVDDEHIRKVIAFGGPAVGKSANMPPHPQLKSRPSVLQALVEVIRSQGR